MPRSLSFSVWYFWVTSTVDWLRSTSLSFPCQVDPTSLLPFASIVMSAELAARRVQLRQNMALRKPVPVYIPSPPSSPNVSFFQGKKPGYAASMSAVDSQNLPPLPEGWRETISRATSLHSLDNSDRFYYSPNSISSPSPRSGRRSVSGDARSRYSTKSPGGGSRAYRQSYRPPTPPKPAVHRMDRDQFGSPFQLQQSEKYRAPTLSTQPSFMTEKSRSTFGTSSLDSGTSTPASQGQVPSVHGVTVLPMFIVAKPKARQPESRGCFSVFWSRLFRC
ncbi:hypothetical protein EDD85DRAFT_308716 [Armillaria nabsnona]|nr:hypothetical protein EDD85DRAFT_308716 [Armillaria nabsnona]